MMENGWIGIAAQRGGKLNENPINTHKLHA